MLELISYYIIVVVAWLIKITYNFVLTVVCGGENGYPRWDLVAIVLYIALLLLWNLGAKIRVNKVEKR